MKYKVLETINHKTEREFETLEAASKWLNNVGVLYECENPKSRVVVGLLKITIYQHRDDYMPAEKYEIQEIN